MESTSHGFLRQIPVVAGLFLFSLQASGFEHVKSDSVTGIPIKKAELLVPTKSVVVANLDASMAMSVVRGDGALLSTGNKIEQERDFLSAGERPLTLVRMTCPH